MHLNFKKMSSTYSYIKKNDYNLMDNFYLVLIKNTGEVIHNIFATSHKDLIAKYITPEDVRDRTYFKATFTPKEGCRLDDIDNYQLLFNEVYIPEWFSGELEKDVKRLLRHIIGSMIIKNHRQLLLHEGGILVGKGMVSEMKHSIIFAMYDESVIDVLDNSSEVRYMTDDCFIVDMRDSTRVEEMLGFSKVKQMHNYSKIIKMYGQAKVGEMFDNSRIAMLKGDANILEMHDASQADRLKHLSCVSEMHGHSVIEEMWDWTLVEKMFDQSRINYMDEDSKVLEMHDESMIEMMAGNAIVEKLCENSLVRKLTNAAKILEQKLNN
jgi:hypothetical protein